MKNDIVKNNLLQFFTRFHSPRTKIMPNNLLTFSVEPALEAKGLKIKAAIFSVPSISRRRGNELEKHIKEVIAALNIEELLASPILAEYKKLQKEAGIAQPLAPAEYLLQLIQKSGMLPNINRVVDCYNIASAQTLLSMGAHDLTKIKGNLQLKTTDGTEKYTPLGKSEPEKATPGEYAAMDEEKIICRMDIKQCDETKCGQSTTDFIVYVQGNAETSNDYVAAGLQKVCGNIKNFCGGDYRILE